MSSFRKVISSFNLLRFIKDETIGATLKLSLLSQDQPVCYPHSPMSQAR